MGIATWFSIFLFFLLILRRRLGRAREKLAALSTSLLVNHEDPSVPSRAPISHRNALLTALLLVDFYRV
jgi:hypothetical protein